MQPILPVAMTSGAVSMMLAILRSRSRKALGLQNIVSAGRAAAQMPFWDVADVEACLRQELPRQGVDLLAMLHRAGGVVGHRRALRIDRLRLIKLAKKFRHILGERGNPRRFCRIGGL